MKKKTVLIDLDGVLNDYNGSYNDDFIPPIRAGAKEFLANLSKNYKVKLFTCRNKILATKWLIDNGLDEYITDITDKKELCWLYVDDRCIKFNGNFEELAGSITNFTPWYKDNASYNSKKIYA